MNKIVRTKALHPVTYFATGLSLLAIHRPLGDFLKETKMTIYYWNTKQMLEI